MIRKIRFSTHIFQFVTFFVFIFFDASLLSAQGDDVPELEKNQGYLLINLDVGGIAPSIEYRYLSNRSGSQVHTGTIALKNKDKGFYMIPLKAGYYQVTRVNAPYYNLPYRLDTSSNKKWEFQIEESRINYFGTLEISEMRKLKSVYVRRKNRIGRDYAKIQSEFADQLQRYPLSVNTSYRDDFFPLLNANNSEHKSK